MKGPVERGGVAGLAEGQARGEHSLSRVYFYKLYTEALKKNLVVLELKFYLKLN